MKSKPHSAKEESFAAVADRWKRGEFKPVYLLAGPDSFQKEDALALLQKHFLSGDDSGLNVDRFDGATAKSGAIVGAAATLPFLGGNRLILVRRAHDLSAAEVKNLAEGVSSVAQGNCLVLLWDEKLEGSNALARAVRDAGEVITFWVPFENQLPRWIQERAQSFGKTMSQDAARLCLEAVGPNPAELNQEIEKLALYVKERKAIEPQDVEALRPESRTLQFHEWDRAFWKKDRAKALNVLELLRAQGEEAPSLLAQILRVYRRLMLGKALVSEKNLPAEAIYKSLRIGSFDTRREFDRALETHSWKELIEALERILQAEEALKTGRMNDVGGVSLLVCRLTEPN